MSRVKKIILWVSVSLFLYLCLNLGYYYYQNTLYRRQITILENNRDELAKKIKELDTSLNEAREEIKKLKKPSGEIVTVIPADCKSCFEKYEYEYSVIDKKERWKFYDSNVFDNKPGELTLLPKFYEEYINPCQESLDRCLEELKKGKPKLSDYIRAGTPSITVGVGISGYYAQFDYYFLSFGKSVRISLGLNSFFQAPPTNQLSDITYNVGIGCRVEF